MTARALRVGVLLGGNLVEEKLFRDTQPITIGQSLRCQLSIPVEGVPYEHALFVRDQGQLLLKLTDKMAGRIAQGGEIKTDIAGTVRIERGARGKLQIGDATVLFQEVAMPAAAPRPQLPASVRGTFADRIDRRLATIVGASIMLHIGIAAWAWATDVERPGLFESKRMAEFRQETYVIDVPDETVATAQEPGATQPVAPVQTPRPIVQPTRITTTPRPTEPGMTTDDAQRFAQILTNSEETPNGRTGMNGRSPGATLEQQIGDIRDNNREIGKTEKGFREGPRDHMGTGRDHIVDGENNQLEATQPREELPKHRIDLRPPPTGPKPPKGNKLTPELIVAKIKSDYMSGLMRCYEKGLLGDSKLGGKVAITFTVSESGKLADPGAHGVSIGVDGCIAGFMNTWRFPQPKNAANEPEEVDFGVTLALVSGN